MGVQISAGGHNPYFGLTFNAKAGNFEAGGGGIGVFEDRAVEPLIFAFFRHYLLEGRKELFKGSMFRRTLFAEVFSR